MANAGAVTRRDATRLDTEFTRGLGLFDATMVVVGSMIGSGIFIVPADMARQIGSPGWLLVAWIVTGVLTVTAALSYGELAAMMPRAGGQYVYLREAFSPLWGFLYGWTLFLVIQTGTIAAVAVAFARFLGVIWPAVSEDRYLVPPIHLSDGYAVSLSTAQLVGVLLVALLTWTNTRGLNYGRIVQNIFTTAKTGALVALIALGLLVGWNAEAVTSNFAAAWTARGQVEVAPGLSAATAFGLFVAIAVAQTGSLFSSDAWNNVTFTAGEVRDPRRTLPRSLALGTASVIALYLLANLAYLVTLPLEALQQAPSDRVATATLDVVVPGLGAPVMAIAIMISTFGCNNGLILGGARVYYAMAKDGLFFRPVAKVHPKFHTPHISLLAQGVWASVLCLTGTYGALLDYTMFAVMVFYILTIIGLFVLRRTRPDAPRPYKAFGYPVLPALYILMALYFDLVLLLYKPQYSWPGLIIVLIGIPVYLLWSRRAQPEHTLAD
jgi:APA family basic amino acid/polyamine antiporter